MGTLAFCVYLVLPALAVCGNANVGWLFPNPIVHEVWPDVLMPQRNLFHTPSFGEPWPSFQMPFQNLDMGSGFAIKLKNSSWTGPTVSNTYPRGALVYLQVSASLPPDQELYIQSCYATSSPDLTDESRLTLIQNKGCVASKQSVIKFISRKRDSINLLLNTSTLKFSQINLHCSVVATQPALTPDTKSCNYDQSKARWVELGGHPGVCDCCATNCRGPPYLGGPYSETKAVISTGPLSIKEHGHEAYQPSVFTHSSFTSSIASSPIKTSSGADRIVAAASSRPRIPSAPWFNHPVVLGNPFSMWYPGHGMVQPHPILGVPKFLPKQWGVPKIIGFPSPVGFPFENMFSRFHSEAPLHAFPGLNVPNPQTPEFAGVHDYVADEPAFTDLEQMPEEAPEEELRGDVFMNYKWEGKPWQSMDADGFVPPLAKTDASENPPSENKREALEEVDEKITGSDFDGMEFLTRSRLTYRQGFDGSSVLSYEEEEKNPSLGDQEVKRTSVQLAQRGSVGEGEPKKLDDEVVQSLLDMLRGLNKMVTGHEQQYD